MRLMDSQSGGSFIPKKTPGKPVSKINTGRVIGVFGYVCYAVFFGSLLLSLGMFGLSYYVQTNLLDRQDRLVTVRETVSEEKIQELIMFDTHLRSAEGIFDNSFSVPYILGVLENIVAEPVVFYFLTLEQKDGKVRIEGSALTDSFDATLFQREVLQETPGLAAGSDIKQVRLTQGAEQLLRRFVVDAADGSSAQTDIEAFVNRIGRDEIVVFTLALDIDTDQALFSLDEFDTEDISAPATHQSEQDFFEVFEDISEVEDGSIEFSSEQLEDVLSAPEELTP